MSGLLVLPVIAATSKAKPVAEKKAVVIQGDPVAGKLKSEDQRCQECHAASGRDHSNAPEFKPATLAGQYPEYIVKQMHDFRTSKRKHEFMTMMANTIDETDLADIAAYFGSEKWVRSGVPGDVGKSGDLARNLYLNGDPARNIIACASCHGAAGEGIASKDALYPVIGGQEPNYLQNQLLNWRSGERRNSTGDIMNITSKSLTDAEIEALAHYLSGL